MANTLRFTGFYLPWAVTGTRKDEFDLELTCGLLVQQHDTETKEEFSS